MIVSLDGSKEVHDKIRNIPNAFDKLKEGVQELKRLNPKFRVTARCVIQKENFKDLPNIVDAAREIGLDQISFLTADVTTDAFNRPELWGEEKVGEIKLSPEELERFKEVIETSYSNVIQRISKTNSLPNLLKRSEGFMTTMLHFKD
ncbi:MAG: hypothetical protein MZV64_74005 [Ignavibacteriales bacterium]|nr:hypothetical protein [Ignavibacteriales bacterium]